MKLYTTRHSDLKFGETPNPSTIRKGNTEWYKSRQKNVTWLVIRLRSHNIVLNVLYPLE